MYTKIFFIIFLIITFFLGLYVTGVFNINTVNKEQDIETFEPIQDCPNLLVRKNDILLMYNTNKPIIENVNPMPFYNLDEYINFVNIQREKGMQCPILFLQHENNAQGEDVYRARPSPFDMQGGLQTGVPNITYKENTNKMLVPYLDASKSHPPYNKNQFTTNTSMFGFGTCDGTIEIKDGEHHRNILCTVNDSFGNKGYLKAVEANKKK